jgi:hypothetical protein
MIKKMKLPKELKEKEKLRKWRVKKRHFTPSKEMRTNREKLDLVIESFLSYYKTKGIPLQDLDFLDIYDLFNEFLTILERNKGKRNTFSRLHEIWSKGIEKELKRKNKTGNYTPDSPTVPDRDLHETLINNIME